MTTSERPCHFVPRYSRQSSFRNYSLEAFSPCQTQQNHRLKSSQQPMGKRIPCQQGSAEEGDAGPERVPGEGSQAGGMTRTTNAWSSPGATLRSTPPQGLPTVQD